MVAAIGKGEPCLLPGGLPCRIGHREQVPMIGCIGRQVCCRDQASAHASDFLQQRRDHGWVIAEGDPALGSSLLWASATGQIDCGLRLQSLPCFPHPLCQCLGIFECFGQPGWWWWTVVGGVLGFQITQCLGHPLIEPLQSFGVIAPIPCRIGMKLGAINRLDARSTSPALTATCTLWVRRWRMPARWTV